MEEKEWLIYGREGIVYLSKRMSSVFIKKNKNRVKILSVDKEINSLLVLKIESPYTLSIKRFSC